MRRKPPTSFTIHPTILAWLEELRRLGGYANKSELVAALIRDEHARKFGPPPPDKLPPPDDAPTDPVPTPAPARHHAKKPLKLSKHDAQETAKLAASLKKSAQATVTPH